MILTQDTLNLLVTVFYSALFVYSCVSVYRTFIHKSW